MKQTLDNQRGMALLLVLVIVALLSALLTELAFSTLVDLRLAETFRDSTRAAYLAKGGVRVGREFLQMDNNDYDHDSENWYQGVAGLPVGDGFATVTIRDQDGLLNLNRLVINGTTSNVFKQRCYKLFSDLGLPDPEDLTAALIDWIDTDDIVFSDNITPNIVGRGAESSFYLGLQKPRNCKNRPLDSLDELGDVHGFTPEVIAALIDLVTVYGPPPIPGGLTVPLNINTAPKQVLFAWYSWADQSMNDSLAETIVQARKTAPIKDSDLTTLLSDTDYGKLNQQGDIVFKSNYYKIISTGDIVEGSRTVEAMIGKTGNQLLYLKVN